MINNWTTLLVFLVPITIYAIVLIRAAYRVHVGGEAKTAKQYALGSGKYKLFIIFSTLVVTMIGPSYTLGIVGEAYKHGFLTFCLFALVGVTFIVTGIFFAKRLQKHADPTSGGARTTGDVMGYYFGSWSQLLTGIITVIQGFVIVGLLALGADAVISVFWDIPSKLIIIPMILLAIGYAAIGGMPAVLRTDKWQFGFLIAMCVIVAGLAIWNLPQVPLEQFWQYDSGSFPLSEIIALGAAMLLGEALLPIYSVRGLLADEPKYAKKGFILAGIFGIVWFFILTLVGIASTTMVGEVGDKTLLQFVASGFEGSLILVFLAGVVVAALLGAIMSSLDSLLNTGAVASIRDVLGKFKYINEKEERRYELGATLFIGIAGIIAAFLAEGIIQLLVLAFTLWVPSIMPPLAYALFRGPNRLLIKETTCLLAISAGALTGFIFWMGWVPIELPGIIAGLLVNVCILIFGHFREKSKKSF